MKNTTSLALILIYFIGASLNGQENQKLVKQFDDLAKTFQSQHKPPGFTVAVSLRNEIIFEKAYGKSDLENDVKTKIDTVFRTASIAKPITAVAVLQLVERGKIKLDDSINQHCPEFPKLENAPTIRQLLCHQGGIRHYKASAEAAGKEVYFTIADSIKLFKDDALLSKPGTKFRYTTYGYSLLGRAIETASGMSYRDYLQNNVFVVAGM